MNVNEHTETKISIHVPREGDDAPPGAWRVRWEDFYPRPPRGGRPFDFIADDIDAAFLSTSPARGTTG